MKTVGLITEYNPFHNGHLYHIKRAKELTGADRVIVIMSGNFVQRGAAAIMPKHLRTEFALHAGASAVFELPICYATGSAELFALGAITFLEQLDIIDTICFGCEYGNLSLLQNIAKILSDEPTEYQAHLKKELQKGFSFPIARSHAISLYTENNSYEQILNQPNNILAIEYLKVLYKTNSNIKPYALVRKGAGYHDKTLETSFSSASSIRHYLKTVQNTDTPFSIGEPLSTQVPEWSNQLLSNKYHICYPVFTDHFSLILKYALLSENHFEQFQDVSQELSNRILKLRNNFENFSQFCSLLKTKELTYTRISRALIHIMLRITKRDTEHYIKNGIHFYAHLLGFQQSESDVLSKIKQKSSLPLLTKLNRLDSNNTNAISMLQKDCFASDLYESVISDLYKSPFKNEFEKQIIRI